MKILDRYISVSVAAAFLSGVTIFMILLSAMALLPKLLTLIAKEGVTASTAISIVAYQLPGMLMYAFPMAMLLSILLTFGRMSSESEMVAIRAAGVSFARIVMPVFAFAILVTFGTFFISNYFVPYANKQSMYLTKKALNEKDNGQPVNYPVMGTDGTMKFFLQASLMEINNDQTAIMRNVSVVTYQDGIPARFDYAPSARYNYEMGYWVMQGKGFSNTLGLHAGDESYSGIASIMGEGSEIHIKAPALVRDTPFDMKNDMKEPNDWTADELRARIARDQAAMARGENKQAEIWKLSTRLAQRYSTPFTCLVFALIGAPLGLRHHRTSSAVGLGVSLIIIFAYYFFSIYLSTFGDSGTLPPHVAAWTPNVLGSLLGIYLITRANR